MDCIQVPSQKNPAAAASEILPAADPGEDRGGGDVHIHWNLDPIRSHWRKPNGRKGNEQLQQNKHKHAFKQQIRFGKQH